MISCQLLQDERPPFFGSFTECLLFQSSGTCSCFQILPKRSCSLSVEVWMLAFGASGGIPSGSATSSDLRDLIALTISVLLGRLVLMSKSLLGGGMTGGTDGAGRLSVSLKCSAHRAFCCSSPRMMFPSLPLTGRLGLLFLLESVLVILYRRFIFRWTVALSASAVSSSMYVLFSCLALRFTCWFFFQYCASNLCFSACSCVLLIWFFRCPLLVISVKVSIKSHSLCFLVFLPRTVLQVVVQISRRPCQCSSPGSSGS